MFLLKKLRDQDLRGKARMAHVYLHVEGNRCDQENSTDTAHSQELILHLSGKGS